MNAHAPRRFATCLLAALAILPHFPAVSSAAGDGHFSGIYVEGDGDVQMLDALNAAFEATRPSPRMANLPLFYKRDWNGLVEGPIMLGLLGAGAGAITGAFIPSEKTLWENPVKKQ